jgi:hypothetical protein
MTDQLWWVVALRDIPPGTAAGIFGLAALGYLTALSRRQWPRLIGFSALLGSIIFMGDLLDTLKTSPTGSHGIALLTIWTLGIVTGVLSLTIINRLR